jgi:hypothetical protein
MIASLLTEAATHVVARLDPLVVLLAEPSLL